MKRGEIWIGNLNPNRGAEAGKIRPVMVMEADWSVERPGETVMILPLTTQVAKEKRVMRPILPARAGLHQESQILVDQIRALDRRRLVKGPVAHVDAHEMAAVERSLAELLGLPSPLRAS